MEAIARFFSELWMLFREMYGLEIVAVIVFFLLGLWLMRMVASARSERIRQGLDEQKRLKEAVAALRGGLGIPEPAAVGGHRPGGGGKLFQDVKESAETPPGASGHSGDVTEGARPAKKVTGRAKTRIEVPSGDLEGGETGDSPPLSTYKAAADAFDGEDGIEIDREYGVLFSKAPDSVDDLKQIKGVGPKIEGQLNEFGVYRIRQIAHWNAYNAEAFSTRLRFKGRVGREDWIPQARKLSGLEDRDSAPSGTVAERLSKKSDSPEEKPATGVAKGNKEALGFYQGVADEKFGGEDVVVDGEFGILFSNRPKKVDDLTRIKGVGKVLSGRLNESGVYRFQQIAHWNEPAVKAFSKRLKSFQDRIHRDRWIEQAAELHRTDHGD